MDYLTSKSYLIDVAIPESKKGFWEASTQYGPQDRNTEDVEYSSCYPSCHLRNSAINFVVSGEALEDFKHIIMDSYPSCRRV